MDTRYHLEDLPSAIANRDIWEKNLQWCIDDDNNEVYCSFWHWDMWIEVKKKQSYYNLLLLNYTKKYNIYGISQFCKTMVQHLDNGLYGRHAASHPSSWDWCYPWEEQGSAQLSEWCGSEHQTALWRTSSPVATHNSLCTMHTLLHLCITACAMMSDPKC